MQRLLILACSQRKRSDASPLPSIERYDGPAFRLLRRYRRLTQDSGLIVYVLSAEFGLIPAKKPIPTYDRRMTSERADDLRSSVAAAVQAAIMRHQPSEVFICAGKTYLRALDRLAENGPRLSVARGGQDEKLASLKAWLHER
jgi:hypothetical protein